MRINSNRGENSEKHLPNRLTLATTICNNNDATQLHTYEVHWGINHLMYMDDMLLAKNAEKLETMIQ